MGVQTGGVSPSSGLATAGIVLTVLLTIITLVFTGLTSGTDQTFVQGVTEFISKSVLYMPNVLFGYGFIADIFNNTGYHYSIASTTALLGMVVNKVLGGTVVGAIATGVSFIAEKVKKAPVAAAAVAAAATAAVAPAAIAAAPAAAAAATGIEMTALPAIAAAPAAAAAAAPVIAPAAAAAAVGTAAAASAPDIPETPQTPDADGIVDDDSFFLTQTNTNRQRGGAITCSLPGFEWLENTIAPQGIIMSMTVLWYLMIELWDTGSGGQTVALGVTTAITFAIQWLVLARNGCLNSYRYTVYSPLVALVMAITFAGTSYGIQKIILKNMSSGGIPVAPVPSGTPGTFVCPPGTVLAANGEQCVTPLGPGGTQNTPMQSIINVGGSNAQSQPVDDNDQFVCEAYKDGELITSTIVE